MSVNADLQVVILAGPGHRMYPLITSVTAVPEGELHKCLLPIGNRPMILHLLSHLQTAGCSSVIIVTAARTVSRLSTVVRNAHFSMDISIVSDSSDGDSGEESSPLQALLRCKDLIRRDFCVLPADLFVSSASLFAELFNSMADAFRLNNASMVNFLMPLKESDDDHDRVLAAVCQLDHDNCFQLLRINGSADLEDEDVPVSLATLHKHPRIKFISNCVELSWYIFSHEVMDLLAQLSANHQVSEEDDDADFWSLREDLLPHVFQLNRVPLTLKIAPPSIELVTRVATVRAYGEVNKFMALSLPSTGKSDVILSESCRLGEKSLVKRSVIGSHVSIGAGSKLINCLVMDGATIGENCKLDNTIVGPKANVGEKATIKDCCLAPNSVVPADSSLKGESIVPSTTRRFDDLFQQ